VASATLKPYVNKLGLRNQLLRAVWQIVYWVLFRFSPTPLQAWRRLLLRLFGAALDSGANVYPSAKIWAPWNLRMGSHSCLAREVDCYCVAPISIGDHALVSQYSFLCSATHDYTSAGFELISKPIDIGAKAWLAADVFVGPGVTIGEGAVIAARSTVVKNVPPWEVWAGLPAKFVKTRHLAQTI
jgi:putative colanic acid biosynthesis acetyltransferase WcaF